MRSPLLGRGQAVRFQGLADLGPVPEALPTPPTLVGADSVGPPSATEGELPFLTIAEAAKLIRTGQLSPVDLTRSLLARIERLNPVLNAYITVTVDLAIEQAKEAEAAIHRGDYLGPLHGIPFALKDILATAGVLTTGGTAGFADWVPKEDAIVWRQLRDAGAVLLGKVNLNEMAFGSTGLNPFYGPVRNPWDLTRITGGSSSGSAAAVAAHLCLASIGSDTSGSMRAPASLCGVTAIKPTYGLVSTHGALHLTWTNDHLGPMTKTVEDAALVLRAIAGAQALSPDRYGAKLDGDLRGLRIAVPVNLWDPKGEDGASNMTDFDVVRAVRTAIEVLRERGAAVTEIAIEGLAMSAPLSAVMTLERTFFLEELPPERKARFSQGYRDSGARGATSLGIDYLRDLERVLRTQALLEAALEPYDAFVLPTTPVTAPTLEATEAASARATKAIAMAASGASGASGAKSAAAPPKREQTAPLTRYTAPFSWSGQPALTVPCGFDSVGLPIGMMIVGKHFDEATTFRIGHAYERATEWHKRTPPLR